MTKSSLKKQESMALAMVGQARAAIAAHNSARARDLLTKAWAQAKQSEKALISVAGTLIDMCEDDLAYSVLQEAAVYQGESDSLYRIIGEMALRMQLPGIAETAFTNACRLNAAEPSHYVNLAESLRLNDKPDDAIELLKTSLPQFPDHAGMWNALAQLTLIHLQDRENALIFQEEAVRNAPRSANFLHNLALMYASRPEAAAYYEAALKSDPKNSQINTSYGLYLLARTELEKGWKHYEYRLDPDLGYSKAARYTHGLPAWKGQSLSGKSILLCAEQGIGDEVMFAAFIPEIIRRAEKVYIGCEPRLVSLYERSFPSTEVAAFSDARRYRVRERSFPALEDRLGKDLRIDYALQVGSLPRFLAPDLASYRSFPGGFAKPDPARVTELAPRIADTGRPKVAISWRSGNLKQERRHGYLTTDLVRQLCAQTDADFYVLQYTYDDAEKAALADLPNVHFLDGLDLKQDIEANIALLSLMDVSVGPPTATQMLAMAVGCPVIMVNKGAPWMLFGRAHRLEKTFAPGSLFIDPLKDGDPVELIGRRLAELAARPGR